MLERLVRPNAPTSLRATLGPLTLALGHPCARIDRTGAWRATRTPDGAATTHFAAAGADIVVRAWGPGARWALDAAPALLGGDDDTSDFAPRHPVVAELHRRHPGLRLGRTSAVVEVLVPTVIAQKVVGLDARRSYARLVRAVSEPAPGPAGLLLPPDPRVVAGLPWWRMHAFGIERRRADTLTRACGYAPRLEETVAMPRPDGRRRLEALPGIGAWTSAEVAVVAFGDPDAVSVGDYHLPGLVSWALAGQPRGDDERMLELLEPFRGHRARVLRLLEAGAPGPPRRGPRMPRQDLARL